MEWPRTAAGEASLIDCGGRAGWLAAGEIPKPISESRERARHFAGLELNCN